MALTTSLAELPQCERTAFAVSSETNHVAHRHTRWVDGVVWAYMLLWRGITAKGPVRAKVVSWIADAAVSTHHNIKIQSSRKLATTPPMASSPFPHHLPFFIHTCFTPPSAYVIVKACIQVCNRQVKTAGTPVCG